MFGESNGRERDIPAAVAKNDHLLSFLNCTFVDTFAH